MNDRNLKVSVVGSGKIVKEVLPLITRPGMRYTVTSIFAHSNIDNARALAGEFGIPEVYTDYDRLLQDADADFIYIANINTAHNDFALKALEHGRNVIVEKPLCINYSDAARLINLAREKHLYFFEAVSLLYNPLFSQIAEALPEIGEISMVTSNYSQLSSRYAMYCNHVVAPAFDPELAGGALMDLNVYNINFAIGLFGGPLSATYFMRRGYNSVDLSGVAVLQYPGFPVVCCAAKDSDAPSGAIIQGDKGYIEVKSPVSVLTRAEVYVGGKLTATLEVPDGSHRLEHEFRSFREIYLNGDYEAMEAKCRISLDVMYVMSDLRK